MQLYRGTQKRPRFFVMKLQDTLENLESLASATTEKESIFEYIQRVGADTVVELHNLRGIGGAWFFTDDETVAREFAGDKGFLITMDIDGETAGEHSQGTQMMSPGKEVRYASNFVFGGKELYEHLVEWKIDVIEIERENAELHSEAKRGADSEFRPRMR